jgi:NAD(P)-dependent dehydrogenase (short-subunit alcohol dehydrogenase family)
MISAKRGLMVFVSADTEAYAGDLVYDLAMAATNRLALATAAELGPRGVTALALAPGAVRTERVRDAGLGASATESPLYAGRAVAALAADPMTAAQAGLTLHVADLARRYGFTDADGTQPARPGR